MTALIRSALARRPNPTAATREELAAPGAPMTAPICSALARRHPANEVATRAAVVALAALVACGESSRGATVTMTVSDRAPAYGETPFPTDALRDGDRLGELAGLDALIGKQAALVAAHVAALDGFGVRPVVELFVDGALDPASVPARTTELGDPAGVVDVDPASPERGRVIAMDWRYDAERGVLAGVPASGVVLREGTRYAGFATTAIRAAGGEPLEPAPALHALASYPRWATTAEALAELGDHRIAGLAVFTTEHATAPLLAARAALDAAPPPVLAFDDPAIIFRGRTALDRILGTAARATDGPRAGLERWGYDNPSGMAHDHVGVVGTGSITIVRFRRDDTGTDLPDDETFDLGGGAPRVIAVEPIPITFILPAAPAPAAGYPVVLFGHGLSSSRDALLAFAEPFTSQGFAVVGIDMEGHGSRFDPTDVVANMAGRPQFTGDPTLRDGFGDVTGLGTALAFFETFLNVAAIRDSIRQSALDLCRVAQLLRRPDLDLGALAAGAHLDTRRIAYVAESYGTVVGTLLAAIEPAIALYVLDVPGGGIIDLILPTSAEIGAVAVPLITTIYAPRHPLDRFSPVIGLMQAVLDGGDPLTYAPHVLGDRFGTLGPRSVVALEAVADQVMPNASTDALAQALGLAVLAPHLEAPAGLAEVTSPAAGNRDGQTAVLVHYAPATHGAISSEHSPVRYLPDVPRDGADPFPQLPAPISIANPIYEGQAQIAEILRSYFAGEAPRVVMTKPPVADFDDDGAPDATDAAPYDPAVH